MCWNSDKDTGYSLGLYRSTRFAPGISISWEKGTKERDRGGWAPPASPRGHSWGLWTVLTCESTDVSGDHPSTPNSSDQIVNGCWGPGMGLNQHHRLKIREPPPEAFSSQAFSLTSGIFVVLCAEHSCLGPTVDAIFIILSRETGHTVRKSCIPCETCVCFCVNKNEKHEIFEPALLLQVN